jgi:hypothetical protein
MTARNEPARAPRPDDEADDDDAEVQRGLMLEGRLIPKWGLCPVCHHRLIQHVVRVEHRAEIMRCENGQCRCVW